VKRYLYSYIMYFSLLCLSAGGCTFTSETPITLSDETSLTPSATMTGTLVPVDTAAATPTETLQPTHTFTPTPEQFVLPAVTMSPQEAESALLELLKTNGGCTAKCVAGIRPDEMTVQEAVAMMAQWGMVKIGENSQGKTFISLVQNPLYDQVFVSISIGTWTQELVTIDRLSFQISGSPEDPILGEDVWLANRDTWESFTLANLLKTYGVPSYAGYFFQTTADKGVPLNGRTITYDLEMQYEQFNMDIVMGVLAFQAGGNIFLCPSKDPHNLGIQINPERSLLERQAFRSVTWQALTGTDLEAFYNTFTNENSFDACVTTTLEQIVALQPQFR
jgi:hypothetical protein